MASWVLKAGLSVLFAAQFSNAQFPSSTPNGNLSITATSSSVPTATGGPCCVVAPVDVGLNFWWNQTLTATVATVITQIYQYNNTRITSTTTLSTNGSVEDVTAPAGIIPNTFIYSRTFIGTETSVSFPNTIVASPTPFVAINGIFVIYGTWTQGTGGPACDQTELDSLRILGTAFGYVEDPPTVRTTYVAYANPPPGTELLDYWIEQTPTIIEEIPGLKTCSIPSGSGEPSVHVPVTGLTSHATTTINVDGGGPAPPVSSTTEVPAEPVTTPEPTQTNAPAPEPTEDTTRNPPPAEGTETNNPPGNTIPSNSEQPAPTNTGSNPNPNTNNPEQPAPTNTETSANPNPDNPSPNNPNPNSPSPNNPSPNSPSPNNPNPNSPSPNNPNPNSPSPNNPNPNSPSPNNPNPDSPQQPAPSTGGSPNNPQQPVPTTAGTPNNNNPGNSNPNLAPGAPLPIDLTPVPAPAPVPTTANAPPETQPIVPPAVILPDGQTLRPGTITTVSGHTISVPTDAPSITVVGGTTVQAPPVVVVDGMTATLVPTSAAAPVLSVTVGEGSSASVVSISAVPTPGGGVVLPNGQTLLPGSTITYGGETLVLTTAQSGGPSMVEVIDGSTTEIITVPTTASSSVFVYGNSTATRSMSGSGNGVGSPSQTTGAAPEEATGAGDELSPRGTVAALAALGAAVIFGL